MSKKILITGASGLIGSQLSALLSKNHSIVHLGRTKKDGKIPSFVWDVPQNEIDEQAFEGVDTIIHLAGASVAEKRWTAARKKEILDSRVQSTALLFDILKKQNHSVKTFIAASAIGYYGFEGDSVFTEKSAPGGDFLAQVTRQWEAEEDKVTTLGIRVVKIRIGILLSNHGGALQQMALPVKYGVGSPLGSGNQYLSWIHQHDLCNIFISAIEDERMSGAYNATANWCTNEEITKAIAKVLRKPLLLPKVPAFVLRVVLGEMADIVLSGSKVSPERLKQLDFQFQFHDLEVALKDLYKK